MMKSQTSKELINFKDFLKNQAKQMAFDIAKTSLPTLGKLLLRKAFTVVYVESNSEESTQIMQWLQDNPQAVKRLLPKSNRVGPIAAYKSYNYRADNCAPCSPSSLNIAPEPVDCTIPEVTIKPHYDGELNIFKYQEVWVKVNRIVGKHLGGDRFSTDLTELVFITKNKAIPEAFFNELKRKYTLMPPIPTNSAEVFGLNYSDWHKSHTIYQGNRDAILPKVLEEDITKDLDWFRVSRPWYYTRGIPYRRGYLFYGTPGSGKTTTALSMALSMNAPIFTINLGDKDLTDNNLLFAIRTLNAQTGQRLHVLLFEDIDCMAANRKEGEDGVNFSTILNILDGANAGENRITIMTTNHIDKLDPALIRPGRIDKQVYLDLPDAYQIEKMLLRYYPDDSKINIASRVKKILKEKLSMAALQESLIEEAILQAKP